MDVDSIDTEVDRFLKPLKDKGYTNLSGDNERNLTSLESQFRRYYVSSRELETNDHIKDRIEDGYSKGHTFQLTAFEKSEGKGITYTFHCLDRNMLLSLKKMDVTIDRNTISIPIYTHKSIPSPGLAKELHEFKYPKLHPRNEKKDVKPDNLKNGRGI